MKLDRYDIIYFLGIGGIGMSALARWFNHMGKQVYGYDRTATPLTAALESEGIGIHYDDQVSNVPEPVISGKESSLVIYTVALPPDHRELQFLKNEGYEIVKRSVALGMVSKDLKTVAVAGTHGKTTTTSMITHLLFQADMNCAGFLGGISQNYGSNFVLNGKFNPETVVVVEADEYDRSFLTLSPDIAVVTSADPDHLDVFGDGEMLLEAFRDFIRKIKPGGILLLQFDLVSILKVHSIRQDLRIITYGIENGDAVARNVRVENGSYHFSYVKQSSESFELKLGVPGQHNIENSLAAITIALQLGISKEIVQRSMGSFRGAKRRFDLVYRNQQVVLIDDYAHHPVEISALVKTLREMFPGKKCTGVFQPHLFSRTRDFMNEFAASLNQLDEVILLDIYPAREKPIEGVTAQSLGNKLTTSWINCSKQDLLQKLDDRELEIVVTIGAGDIDQQVPLIAQYLKKRYETELEN